MKRKLTIFAVIAALLICIMPKGFGKAAAEVSYLPPARTNLLNNGGFENGTDGWDANWAGVGSATVNEGAREGNFAYRLQLGEGSSLFREVDVFPAYDMNLINQKHTRYLVSGWLRKGGDFSDDGTDPFIMGVKIVVADAGKNVTVDLPAGENDKVNFTEADDGYVKFRQEITLEERYKVDGQGYKWYSLQIYFAAGGSTGSVYIDDVSMTYAEQPAGGTIDNLFQTAVTENTAIGTPFCGSEYVFSGGSGDWSVDKNVSYKNVGGASLKYSPNAAPEGTNIYMTIPINRFANDIYHFSFMVKGKGAAVRSGLSAAYPNGIYSFPWLRGEGGGDTRFPERMNYKTDDDDWAYRPFANGINQNGGVVVGTTPEDFDWKKVEVIFNPHAFVSEARSIDGKTYSGDDIVDFALILYTMGLQGEYWFDSFKLYRDGTSEPDFTTDFTLTAQRIARGYLGEQTVIPAPTALCMIEDELRDVSDDVVFTVIDPEGTAVRDGVAATEENLRILTDKEGWYSVRFYVSEEGRERILEYDFSVAERDTVKPVIIVSESDITGKAGERVKIPAATATDDKDGTLTSYITVEILSAAGDVIMSARQANVENVCLFSSEGKYKAVYTLSDSSGNEAEPVTVDITIQKAGGCGAGASADRIALAALILPMAALSIKRNGIK